ncbi:hypothetical protein HDV05_002757 [Chytridiales sp. JEL 0842]|nr:hypothetical protein HDV05_002757 [Chytridiales sp. JEL 0842]
MGVPFNFANQKPPISLTLHTETSFEFTLNDPRMGFRFKEPFSFVLLGQAIFLVTLALVCAALSYYFRSQKGYRSPKPPVAGPFVCQDIVESFTRRLALSTSRFSKSVERNFLFKSISLYFGPFDGAEPREGDVTVADAQYPGLTDAQRSILTVNDLIVLDPHQKGVNHRLAQHPDSKKKRFTLARFELGPVITSTGVTDQPSSKKGTRQFVEAVCSEILPFLTGDQYGTLFDGVCLTGTELFVNHLDALRNLCTTLTESGVMVFIELTPPRYQSDFLDSNFFDTVNGVILHNVCINNNGSAKDYFDIDAGFWKTVKIYTKQVALRKDFCALVVEIYSPTPGVPIRPAQFSRLFKLTQFYNAMPWATTVQGLTDAEHNKPLVRPSGLLDLMDQGDYQAARNAWRKHVTDKTIRIPTDKDSTTTRSSAVQRLMSLLDPMGLLNRENTVATPAKMMKPSIFQYAENYSQALPYLPAPAFNRLGQHDVLVTPSFNETKTVLDLQISLQRKKLLAEPREGEVPGYIDFFVNLKDSLVSSPSSSTSPRYNPMEGYLAGLINDLQNGTMRIWRCLDTSLTYRPIDDPNATNPHFWALWTEQSLQDSRENGYDVYISLKHPRPVEALLACYLCKLGLSAEEIILADLSLPSTNRFGLPSRVQLEITEATPVELLTLLHMTTEQDIPLYRLMRPSIRHALMNNGEQYTTDPLFGGELVFDFEPTGVKTLVKDRLAWYQQVATLVNEEKFNNVVYESPRLTGQLTTSSSMSSLQTLGDGSDMISRTIKEVIRPKARVSPTRRLGSSPERDLTIFVYDEATLEAVVEEIAVIVRTLVVNGDNIKIKNLIELMTECLSQSTKIDVDLEFLVFATFMAFKREAYQEVYLCTNDFNPLPCRQPDQPGLMAELYVLGTRCDEFFDLSINVLSRIMYMQRQLYLQKNPPPVDAYHPKKFMYLYKPLIHCGDMPRFRENKTPRFRLQFLSSGLVFVVPSIIDVLLLLLTGRGIFLNNKFTDIEQRAMTVALLLSLLASSFINGAVSYSGSYYLYLYHYTTMVAVICRIYAGHLLFFWILAAIGSIIFGSVVSAYGAGVFMFFFVALSIYFSTISALATIHTDIMLVTSGRSMVWFVIPYAAMLLTSSYFVVDREYQIVIYAVFWGLMAVFSLALLRKVFLRFLNWLSEVVPITENDVINWYENKYGKVPEEMMFNRHKNNLERIARTKLVEEVDSGKYTRDPFVLKLRKSFPMTDLLIQWHSAHLSYEIPDKYGPEWNMNIKLALADAKKLNKGSKTNRSRLIYKFARCDIMFSVAFFMLLLLDRWIVLLTGGDLLGLIITTNVQSSWGQGFSLLGFLFTCIFCEQINRMAWQLKEANTEQGDLIRNSKVVDQVYAATQRKTRNHFFYLLSLLGMAFAFSTLLISIPIWYLSHAWESVILYTSLSVGYVGLSITVLARIFYPQDSLVPTRIMFSCGIVALIFGITMSRVFPNMYMEQVAVVLGIWSSAFIVVYFAPWWTTLKTMDTTSSRVTSSSGQCFIGAECPDLLPYEPSNIETYILRPKAVHVHNVSQLGREVVRLLSDRVKEINHTLMYAFPDLEKHAKDILLRYSQTMAMDVYVVPLDTLRISNRQYQSLSIIQSSSGHISVYVGVAGDNLTNEDVNNMTSNPDVVVRICEALIHEGLMNVHKYPRRHAVIAERLVSMDPESDEEVQSRLPIRIASQLTSTSADILQHIVASTRREIVKHLAFGLDPDVNWFTMDDKIKNIIVNRVEGMSCLSTEEMDVLKSATLCEVPLLETRTALSCSMALLIGHTALYLLQSTDQSRPVRRLVKSPKPESSITDLIAAQNAPSALDAFIAASSRASQLLFSILFGDEGVPRELDASLSSYSKFTRTVVKFVALNMAKLFRASNRSFIETVLWAYTPELAVLKNLKHQEVRRVITDKYVQLHSPLHPETAFVNKREETSTTYNHYSGILQRPPSSKKQLNKVSWFNEDHVLLKQELWRNLKVIETAVYSYETDPKTGQMSIFPSRKECTSDRGTATYFYDADGLVRRGLMNYWNTDIEATYVHSSDMDILEATYKLRDIEATLRWYISPGNEPHLQVPTVHIQSARLTIAGVTTVTTWDNLRTGDPALLTVLEADGTRVSTPEFIIRDEFQFFTKAPRIDRLNFYMENILFFERRHVQKSKLKKMKKLRSSYGTGKARWALWKKWLDTEEIHGVWVRMIDEYLLRQEPLLKPYWRHRDNGNLEAAVDYLKENEIAIKVAIHFDDDVYAKLYGHIQFADLISMADIGGDVHKNAWTLDDPGLADSRPLLESKKSEATLNGDQNTQPQKLEHQLTIKRRGTTERREETVEVFAAATGTWPSSSGGVSNCIRDVVDNLESIRWNVFAETAHDYELILTSFQVTRHVECVAMIPLWGFDGLDQQHNFYTKRLDADIEMFAFRTTPGVVQYFINRFLNPIICMLYCPILTKSHMTSALNLFCEYYDFFQVFDYNAVWEHPLTLSSWLRILSDQIPVDALDIEMDSKESAVSTRRFIQRALFCLTVKMPSKPPQMIQTTHHAIGSIYAVVMKAKTGAALQVWDHGVLWREYLGHWSGSESTSTPSFHNCLLGLGRLTAAMAMHFADSLVPCTKFSNPTWEVIIGTNINNMVTSTAPTVTPNKTKYHLNNASSIARKIDPVVNGIVDLNGFFPHHDSENEKLTVVMLSHIVVFKDIKNAIFSADIIVNKFGIKGYNLEIYGSSDKIPWYTSECNALISVLGLQNNVALKGFGDSKLVLNSSWLVLNSSIAEGLPLALGEAGLAGIPIVCTMSGGSREVIADEQGRFLGRAVSPGNPYELALAQLQVLGSFDGFEAVATGKEVPNPTKLTELIEQGRFDDIYERIMTHKHLRRQLGQLQREYVRRKFAGERYLREHEQLLNAGAWSSRYTLRQ